MSKAPVFTGPQRAQAEPNTKRQRARAYRHQGRRHQRRPAPRRAGAPEHETCNQHAEPKRHLPRPSRRAHEHARGNVSIDRGRRHAGIVRMREPPHHGERDITHMLYAAQILRRDVVLRRVIIFEPIEDGDVEHIEPGPRQRRDVAGVREHRVNISHNRVGDRPGRRAKSGSRIRVRLVRFEEDRRSARATRFQVDQRFDRSEQRIVVGELEGAEQRRLLAIAEQEDHAPRQALLAQHPRHFEPNRKPDAVIACARRCSH